jgi:hypothetical protein
MDDSFRKALFGAAGELQVAAHEVGVMRVAEADLRAAVRRSLQLLLGARVDPEARLKLVHWPGRLGAADIGVRESPKSSRYTALAECKWCREDKLYEALWDLLKLALASRELELESAYLIVAAPRSIWEKPARCADLFDGIRDGTGALVRRHAREWAYLLQGNKTARPRRVPDIVASRPLGEVAIQTADADDWLLRGATVEPASDGWLKFEDGWPVGASAL